MEWHKSGMWYVPTALYIGETLCTKCTSVLARRFEMRDTSSGTDSPWTTPKMFELEYALSMLYNVIMQACLHVLENAIDH